MSVDLALIMLAVFNHAKSQLQLGAEIVDEHLNDSFMFLEMLLMVHGYAITNVHYVDLISMKQNESKRK